MVSLYMHLQTILSLHNIVEIVQSCKLKGTRGTNYEMIEGMECSSPIMHG